MLAGRLLWFQLTADPTCSVPPDNAADVVDLIQEIVDANLNSSAELDDSELESVVEKLSEVVDVSQVEPPVGADIVGIVADILQSDTDVAPVADMWVGQGKGRRGRGVQSQQTPWEPEVFQLAVGLNLSFNQWRVLSLTEEMGNNMDFQNESVSVAAPLLALSMVNVRSADFRGLTFAVSSTPSTLHPEVRSCSSAAAYTAFHNMRLMQDYFFFSMKQKHLVQMCTPEY